MSFEGEEETLKKRIGRHKGSRKVHRIEERSKSKLACVLEQLSFKDLLWCHTEQILTDNKIIQ